LQCDFAGQLRCAAQGHKIACFGTYFTILWQIAAGLAHDPHRSAVDWLAKQGLDESIVFEFAHAGMRVRSVAD